jgi:hypothetical protein
MKKNLLLMAGLFGVVLLGGCQKEEESVFTMPPALTYDASQLKPFYKPGDTIKMTIAVQPNSTQLLKRLEVMRVYGPYTHPATSGDVHDQVQFDPLVEKCTYSLFYVVKADHIDSFAAKEPDGSIRLTFTIDCVASTLDHKQANNPVSVLIKNQ